MSNAQPALLRSTLAAKAATCDSIAKYYPKGLSPSDVAHHRRFGVLPEGVSCPVQAAAYWRAKMAEVK